MLFGATLFFQHRHQSITVVILPKRACLADDSGEITGRQRTEL